MLHFLLHIMEYGGQQYFTLYCTLCKTESINSALGTEHFGRWIAVKLHYVFHNL